jgi:hypothetical protein
MKSLTKAYNNYLQSFVDAFVPSLSGMLPNVLIISITSYLTLSFHEYANRAFQDMSLNSSHWTISSLGDGWFCLIAPFSRRPLAHKSVRLKLAELDNVSELAQRADINELDYVSQLLGRYGNEGVYLSNIRTKWRMREQCLTAGNVSQNLLVALELAIHDPCQKFTFSAIQGI